MIYKYYSNENEYAIENFRNGQICFSHVNQFNDNLEFEITSQEKNCEEIFSEIVKQQIEEMKFKLRVACFCKRADLENMWGYYANKGSGFCLGYDEKELQICVPDLIINEVSYSDKVPIPIDKIDAKDMIIAQTCHKRKCWQEEQEIRALAFLTEDFFFIQKLMLNSKGAWKPLVGGIIACELPVYLNNRIPNGPCIYYSPKNVSITLNPKELIIGRMCEKEYEKELREIATDKKITVRKYGVSNA